MAMWRNMQRRGRHEGDPEHVKQPAATTQHHDKCAERLYPGKDDMLQLLIPNQVIVLAAVMTVMMMTSMHRQHLCQPHPLSTNWKAMSLRVLI